MSGATWRPDAAVDDLLDLLDGSQMTRGPWADPVLDVDGEQGAEFRVLFVERRSGTRLLADVDLDRVRVWYVVDERDYGYTMTPSLFLQVGWDEVLENVERDLRSRVERV
jgi:hypothetical protein